MRTFLWLEVRYGASMVESIPISTTFTSSSGVRLLGESDWEWRRRGPTPRAVQAFGLCEREVRRLPGGAGYVWTDGRVVVKPVGYVPEHDWVCEVFTAWDSDTVRVPEPVFPKGDNTSGWSVDGWGRTCSFRAATSNCSVN